jgi:hypothetical protein
MLQTRCSQAVRAGQNAWGAIVRAFSEANGAHLGERTHRFGNATADHFCTSDGSSCHGAKSGEEHAQFACDGRDRRGRFHVWGAEPNTPYRSEGKRCLKHPSGDLGNCQSGKLFRLDKPAIRWFCEK